jgi:hypothetical protein
MDIAFEGLENPNSKKGACVVGRVILFKWNAILFPLILHLPTWPYITKNLQAFFSYHKGVIMLQKLYI